MPNFRPVGLTAKPQRDNYRITQTLTTGFEVKPAHPGLLTEQDNSSILHNSIPGHLLYQQALSMPNFRPVGQIATKGQLLNYTNLTVDFEEVKTAGIHSRKKCS